MKLFLKAKDWQLCILALAGTVVGIMVMDESKSSPILTILASVFGALFALWLWTLGAELNKRVDEKTRMGRAFFKFASVFPFVFSVAYAVLLKDLMTPDSHRWFVDLVNKLAYVVFFCLFYEVWFIAKNLVMAERQMPVVVMDYLGLIFSLAFLPIGVWSFQPRVNRLFDGKQV